jgi:hypothetical protein
VLKGQAVDLLDREAPRPQTLVEPPLNKLKQDVNALMLERGFAKNVSEEVSASIVTAACEFLKKEQRD